MTELPVGAVIAGLTIRGTAGRGGMGVVYRAFDPNLHRSVALKVIAADLAADQEFRERFRRESRSAAAVDHPHIIGIHAAGEADGLLYLTMRYVEGTDLKQLIRSRGRLDPLLATTIVGQIAGALDAAHRRGLVHRDVKPANVLVDMTDGRPHAYLTDFGLTRPIGPGEQLTRTGVLMGTFEYMAPELFNGLPAGVASDVYALGCVLHHTLTGVTPFRNQDLVPMIAAHMSAPPPGLGAAVADPPLRAALEQVIASALAKRPQDRPRSAGALGSAAQAVVAQARRAETAVGGGGAAATVDVPAPWPAAPEPPDRAADTDLAPSDPAPPDPATDERTARLRPVGPVYAPPPGSTPTPLPESGPGAPPWSGPSWVLPAGGIGSDVPTQQGPSWAPPAATPWRVAEPDPVAPAEPASRRRAPLVLAAAAAIVVIGGGAAVWYTTVGSSPAAATGASATTSPSSAVRIDLAVPVDKSDSVTLTWTGPSGWDYGVDVAADGKPTETVPVQRVNTWTTKVEPGTRYCFQVRGTDGQQFVNSNFQGVRGAVCTNS